MRQRFAHQSNNTNNNQPVNVGTNELYIQNSVISHTVGKSDRTVFTLRLYYVYVVVVVLTSLTDDQHNQHWYRRATVKCCVFAHLYREND